MLSSKSSKLDEVQYSKSDLETQLQGKIKENETLLARLSTKERGTKGLSTELQQEKQKYNQLQEEYVQLQEDMSRLQHNHTQLQQECSGLKQLNSQQKFDLDQKSFDLQQKIQKETTPNQQLQLQKDDQIKGLVKVCRSLN